MFNSKRKQAIQSLQKQKDKLKNNEVYKDDIWVLQTREIVKRYFGEESVWYEQIQFQLFSVGWKGEITPQIQASIDKQKNKATMIIDGIIDAIKTTGIKENVKTNFLSGVSQDWLTTIMLFAIGVIFGAGYLSSDIGHKIDEQAYQRTIENKDNEISALKDKILSLTPANFPANNQPATEQGNNEKKTNPEHFK